MSLREAGFWTTSPIAPIGICGDITSSLSGGRYQVSWRSSLRDNSILLNMIKNIFNKINNKLGYTSAPLASDSYADMEQKFLSFYELCRPYTMTSIERMYSLYKAMEYVVKNLIPGDIVECGVWRGGSSMMTAFTLSHFKEERKKIFLYDTYEGMSEPSGKDVEARGFQKAWDLWKQHQTETHNTWCYASLDEVRTNLYQTGYPRENLVFVKGRVQDTIPETIPETISLLRLDTDWYDSTYHELCHLFPRLAKFGVLIIDDYGHWQGAREAVDQYFQEQNEPLLLNRIDNTGRIGIKLHD